ncbi:MAG: hypothetical protein J3K34DRAFT_35836 [Monoraphidium minutum]|nr:MAG: hypothetical protein J3K34DRAFT_35836 [Monoraphidium minutum]
MGAHQAGSSGRATAPRACVHAPRPRARLCGALWVACLLLLHPAAALYHTASQTLHWFSHSAQKLPDRMKYSSLVDDHTGTAVPVAALGRRLGAARAPGAAPPPRVAFVFGEHCREVITSEVGLWLGRLLVDEHSHVRQWPELHDALERAGEAPAGAGADGGAGAWPMTIDAWASELLDQLDIQIIPILSLEGRRSVEAGQLCMRKTAETNVDLNRNWPFAWQKGEPANEQYGGPSPLSEPQSRLVKRLIDSAPLAGYVNVHSGEWALYTPWDSKAAYAPNLPPDLSGLVSKMGDICGCTTGPAGAVSGYLAYGSSMD